MSKSKKKKKNKNNKKVNVKPPKSNKIKVVIGCVCSVLVLAACVTFLCLYNYFVNGEAKDVRGTQWTPIIAYDADGNNVDLAEVYENASYYDYTGSMKFNEDGTFDFWMGVGSPTDGSHTGTYEYDWKEEIIYATFDNGEQQEFLVNRDEEIGDISSIQVNFNDYIVHFVYK